MFARPEWVSQMKYDYIIVGAGLTGLSAAIQLKKRNKKVLVIESSPEVGGRVKTDTVDGFQLDRGFQVLLTDYPELELALNPAKLKLKYFQPGAYVYREAETFKLVADPTRIPGKMFATLFGGVGSLGDKIKLLKLKNRLKSMSVEAIFEQKEIPTADALKEYGFSNGFIDSFLRPFFGGVFLESELNTSRRMFDFCFKMFSEGDTAVPANGMGEIGLQMASQLTPSELLLETTVKTVYSGYVIIENGMQFEADHIIIACDPKESLTGVQTQAVKYNRTTTFYYKYSHSPLPESFLVVGGNGQLINHLAVLTDVSEEYSYTSDALISVNVVDDRNYPFDILAREVKKELKVWFGPNASYWELIKAYPIVKALPVQHEVRYDFTLDEVTLSKGVYQVGDFTLNSSINGALRAGRLLVEKLIGA